MIEYGITYTDLNIVLKGELFTYNSTQIIVNGVTISIPHGTAVKLSDCVKATLQGSNLLIESKNQEYSFHFLGHYFNFALKFTTLENVTAVGGLLGLTENDDFSIANYKKEDFMETSLLSTTSKYNAYKNVDIDCSASSPRPGVFHEASAIHPISITEFTTE